VLRGGKSNGRAAHWQPVLSSTLAIHGAWQSA
jgi:hypothetical protein